MFAEHVRWHIDSLLIVRVRHVGMQGRVVPGKRARRGVGGLLGTFFGTRGATESTGAPAE